uniref:Uncharacterized protein n=1 Tax=Nelumbo nucifera TaxID=4432 RepID=A0A822YT91_NELNU|nr:TPA_asm: hypothetical protein HUJ06_006377 [Nelumbo nucifera]
MKDAFIGSIITMVREKNYRDLGE